MPHDAATFKHTPGRLVAVFSVQRVLNRDWATSMEEDAQDTGGFIRADGSMRVHLEFTNHERGHDDFDVSAGHHKKNTLHLSEALRKVSPVMETRKAHSSLHMHDLTRVM